MSYIGEKDLLLEIARGNISGISSINKFGRSVDVDADTDTDLWDGADGATSTDIWVPPTQARVHNIVSSLAGDDGHDDKDGAHRMMIYGLDSDWAEISEEVILDGTNPVATTNSYLRIYRMKVTEAQDGYSNIGIIKATAVTDATVTAAIQIGNAQTLMAIYSVPANKTAYVTQYYGSIGEASPTGAACNLKLFVKSSVVNQYYAPPYQLKHVQGILNTNVRHEFRPYMKVEEKSDIVLRATDGSDADSDVSGGFDIILVDN